MKKKGDLLMRKKENEVNNVHQLLYIKEIIIIERKLERIDDVLCGKM